MLQGHVRFGLETNTRAEDFGQRGAICRREIQYLAAPAYKAVANRHPCRVRRKNRYRGIKRRLRFGQLDGGCGGRGSNGYAQGEAADCKGRSRLRYSLFPVHQPRSSPPFAKSAAENIAGILQCQDRLFLPYEVRWGHLPGNFKSASVGGMMGLRTGNNHDVRPRTRSAV